MTRKSRPETKLQAMTTRLTTPNQPRKGDLEKDVSVSVTPNRLAQAVVQGGAARRDD